MNRACTNLWNWRTCIQTLRAYLLDVLMLGMNMTIPFLLRRSCRTRTTCLCELFLQDASLWDWIWNLFWFSPFSLLESQLLLCFLEPGYGIFCLFLIGAGFIFTQLCSTTEIRRKLNPQNKFKRIQVSLRFDEFRTVMSQIARENFLNQTEPLFIFLIHICYIGGSLKSPSNISNCQRKESQPAPLNTVDFGECLKVT